MNSELTDIKDKFNDNAHHYDGQRRMLIPCFDDFYSIAVSVAAANTGNPAVLDIGAGTGLLSAFILEKIPGASLTLIDISENMLEAARNRLKHKSDVTYLIGDYSNWIFDKKYDIVASALSIHHLENDQKKQLYENIYANLNPGGIFVNADQVLGSTPFIEDLYKRDWKVKVEKSGLSETEIKAAYERTTLDKMAPLNDQLTWLKEIGFLDVDCIYKYYNFVVMFGRK